MPASWDLEGEPGRLVLTVQGYLKLQDAQKAIARFHDMAEGAGNFTFFLNLGGMSGYETNVRLLWTEALLTRSSQIDLLCVKGVKNPIIRMDLIGMGLAVNLKMKSLDS